MRCPSPSPRRPGFTLVEILVVIVIIGVLVALLLPAIGGAVRTAKDTRVTGEIQMLAQSMASFKEKYGDYPPSRILLVESGDYSSASPPGDLSTADGADLNYAQLAQRSIYYLRKFFPRITLSTSGRVWPATTTAGAGPQTKAGASQFYDFNGNGVLDESPYILQGHECLVFFLGGIPQRTETGYATSGFGRIPTNPFSNNNPNATYMYNGSNRIPPLFEFKNERLVDGEATPKNGVPGYADTYYPGTLDPADFNHYYAYFSAYGGEAYDPNDVNFAEPDTNGTVTALTRRFRVGFPVALNSRNGNIANMAVSRAPNPYTTGPPVSATSTAYHNGRTFQIISPGTDGQYGAGGIFASDGTNHLPPDATYPGPAPPAVNSQNLNTTESDIRSPERDNLTNFTNGKLD